MADASSTPLRATVMLSKVLKPDELQASLRRIFPDVRIEAAGPSCGIFSTTHLHEETSTFVCLHPGGWHVWRYFTDHLETSRATAGDDRMKKEQPS